MVSLIKTSFALTCTSIQAAVPLGYNPSALMSPRQVWWVYKDMATSMVPFTTHRKVTSMN